MAAISNQEGASTTGIRPTCPTTQPEVTRVPMRTELVLLTRAA
ncbi:hypothetical protein GCM10023169_16710 [Georgenia halophila]|uniref:Uncharacterized protein n=1 Tax=Georgenia halophila TaxID=620889 RepID=A0ABP8L420_9MICO